MNTLRSSLICYLFFFISINITFSQSESEPNNIFADADVINLTNQTATVTGSINPTGDLDYFAVTVPSAGVFVLNITDIDPAIDMRVLLYNSSFSQIAFASENNGVPIYLAQVVPSAGTYYIQLSDSGNNDASSDLYNLSIEFNTQDIYEYNNTFADAAPVAPNQTIQAQISDPGDRDFLQVTVPSAGVFVLNAFDIDPAIDLQIRLYNSAFSQIAFDSENNGAPVYLAQVVPAGIYYIELADAGNTDESLNLFSFDIGFNTEDVYEYNNTFAEAAPVAPNQTIQAQISDPGDRDFLAVTVPSAGVFVLNAFDIDPAIDLQIRLHNSAFSQIAVESENNGAPVYLAQLVPSAGTYYIELTDVGNTDQSLDLFSLEIEFNVEDIYEYNNTFADSAPVDIYQTIEGQISDPGDIDHFVVTVPTAGVLILNAFDIDPAIDMQIRLFNAAFGQIEVESENNGAPVLLEELVPAGTYYIQLTDVGNTDESLDLYKLSIDFDVQDIYEYNNIFADASPISKCANIQAAIYDSGDKDFFRFSANAGEIIQVDVTNVPAGITPLMFLYNENFGQIGFQSGAGTGIIDYDFAVPSTGNYYLKIEDGGNTDSSPQLYNLSLGGNCNCNQTITLNNQIIQSFNYHAVQSIFSNGTIADDDHVIFKAGNSIELNSGFEVPIDSELTVILDACD